MKKYFLPLLLLLTLGFSSCDSTTDPLPEASKESMLKNKTWVLVGRSYTTDASSTPVNDFDLIEACNVDNTMKFTTSVAGSGAGSVLFDEGATKCSDTDPQSHSGTWSFLSDQTQLSIIDGADSMLYTIQSLTDNTMVLKITVSIGGISIYRVETYNTL